MLIVPPAKVLLTGATGFVGSHVLALLRQHGYDVHALVRKPGSVQNATEFVGSLDQPASIERAAAGCSAAIHLVGIIAEKNGQTFHSVHTLGTINVLNACKTAGVKRYIHMSALGTRPNAASAYHQTKWAAEQAVHDSGLAFTIFRPSLIHGPRGEFTAMLKNWSLGKAPPFIFMPFFGEGLLGQSNSFRIQPVHISDVAHVFVEALAKPATIGQTYNVAGPTKLTWREMLTIASEKFRGRRKIAIGIPAWYAKLIASLPLPLPFNKDQVLMSQEDNTCDITPLLKDFPELKLKDFAATLSD